jgi:hypothetical protein
MFGRTVTKCSPKPSNSSTAIRRLSIFVRACQMLILCGFFNHLVGSTPAQDMALLFQRILSGLMPFVSSIEKAYSVAVLSPKLAQDKRKPRTSRILETELSDGWQRDLVGF